MVCLVVTFSIRGILGFILGVNICSGTLATFVLSHFFPYPIMPSVAFAITLAYLVVFPFFPDTPQSLLIKKHTEAAIKAMQFYKQLDDPNLAAHEVQMLLEQYQDTGETGKVTLAELRKKTINKLSNYLFDCFYIFL